MKNNQKIIAAVVLAIVAGFILWWACNNGGKENEMVKEENSNSTKMMLEMELIAYSHAEMNFIRLTAEEVNAKIEEEIPFFLYTGRATCQWCRKMVPVLNKVIKEDNIELFYLDSENTLIVRNAETNSIVNTIHKERWIQAKPNNSNNLS